MIFSETALLFLASLSNEHNLICIELRHLIHIQHRLANRTFQAFF